MQRRGVFTVDISAFQGAKHGSNLCSILCCHAISAKQIVYICNACSFACSFPLLPWRQFIMGTMQSSGLKKVACGKAVLFQGSIDTSCSLHMYSPAMIRSLVLKLSIRDCRSSLLFEEIAHLLHADCIDLFQITHTTRLSRLVFLLFLFFATLLLCTSFHLFIVQTALATKVGHCP